MITFRKISKANYKDVLNLDTGSEGIKHCASSEQTLVEATLNNNLENVKAIYLNKKLIGMLYYYLINNDKTVWINRLMIDKKYQNKGYGKLTFKKILNSVIKKYNPEKVEVSISNPILLNLKDKMGFKKLNNKRSEQFYKKHKEYIFSLKL